MSTVTGVSGAVTTTRAKRRRSLPGPFISLAILYVAVVVLCALLAPFIAPFDPTAQDLDVGLSTPSSTHWLGTNDLGQDILSRLIYGARTAVIGPAIIAIVATALASVLGILAGYYGGRVDTVIMRWVDLMLSIPLLLLAIVIVGVVGGGYVMAVALLSVMSAPAITRLVRAGALEQRPRPYIEAAESLGVGPLQIMVRHIWPNVLPIAVSSAFLVFAFSLVTLSSLAFLGLGVPLDSPDWGRMLASSKTLIFDTPVAVLAPGVAIVALASFVSVIGDWAYDRASARGGGR